MRRLLYNSQCHCYRKKHLAEKLPLFLVHLFVHTVIITGIAAAQHQVNGQVVDPENKPLAGVSIQVKNKTAATATAANGSFSLMAAVGDTLAFSSIGYLSKEVVVVNSQMLVKLEPVSLQMDQVVVIAYGRQKAPTVTGSVSVIAGKELAQTPVANVSNMLVGMTPGITGLQGSGEPGQNKTRLRIRGTGTLNADAANPLVVIDGVQQPSDNPFSMLDAMDANDIESISVLKDASTTAVYGVRGANGVIVVTTKRGRSGRPMFNFSASRGFTKATSMLKLTNSYDFVTVGNESIRNEMAAGNFANQNKLFSEEELWKFNNNRDYTPDEVNAMTMLSPEQQAALLNSPALYYTSTDFYRSIFGGTGSQQQYNLSVSGGTSQVRYAVSLGYFGQTSILDHTRYNQYDVDPHYKRYTLRNNLDIDITHNLQLAINLSGQFLQDKAISANNDIGGAADPNDQFNRYQNLLSPIMRSNPYVNPGFVDGRIILRFAGDQLSATNPIGGERGSDGTFPNQTFSPFDKLLNSGYTTRYGNNLNGQVRLVHKMNYVTQGLQAHVALSYDDRYARAFATYINIPTYRVYRNPLNLLEKVFIENPVQQNASISGDRYKDFYRQINYEAALNYSRSFNRHNVSGLLLGTAQKFIQNNMSFNTPSGLIGTTVRATYNFAERYLADASLGYNGTEQFAPGRRFGFFPAASAGWIVSNEPFFTKNKWVSLVKIRGSYGEVGNDQLIVGGAKRRYLYLPNSWTALDGNGYYFGNTNGVGTNAYIGGANELSYGNPNVIWERARKLNLQLDLNFLNNKLSFTGSYFREKRTDILVLPRIVPNTLGINDGDIPAANVGIVTNRGIELELGWRDRIGELSYTVKGMMTYTRNKIEYQAETNNPFPWMNATGFLVDQPKGLIADGFYNTTEELANRPLNTFDNIASLGDIRYKDIDGDGRISQNDLVPIGYPNFPLISFNTVINLNYKGFDFSALFIGTAKGSVNLQGNLFTGNPRLFQEFVDNRWTVEKTAAKANNSISFPSFNQNGGLNPASTLPSSFWVRSSDFVRLKNVNVGYSFTNLSLLQRAGIRSLRIYAGANNLFTWTKLMEGLDPEAVSNNAYIFPLTSTYNFGLNLNF